MTVQLKRQRLYSTKNDFGDSWIHRLKLASRRSEGEDIPLARFTNGARRGPLEDSEGAPGYEEITNALAAPAHSDHAEHAAWVADMAPSDGPIDPAFLDIPAVNRTLAN